VLRTLFVVIVATAGGCLALQDTFYALLLYLWVAYFRPDAWVWGGVVQALDLSFWAGLYVVGRAVVLGETSRLNGRLALIFLLLLESFLSTCFSVDFGYSWGSWLNFAKTLVIAYLIASLVNDPRRFRLVLVTIALSLGLEGTKQGWVQLILNPGGENTNPVPFLGDNNGVAVGMLMLVPILGALAQTTDRAWERLAYRFMLVGVLYRALSTYSRGGFLACLALGAYYVFRSPHRGRALAGAAIATALILPGLQGAYWERMRTITVQEEEMDASAAGRLHFWRVALQMAADRPLTGVGHNAYNSAYDSYDRLKGSYGSERSVHSMWLGALAELGVPGFLLVVANLFLAFRSCRRVSRLEAGAPDPDHLGRYATALEAALFTAAVGGTFVIFQYSEMLWHFVALSIALETIASGIVMRDLDVAPGKTREDAPLCLASSA
jgi:probable O-glycosylation ligase (exosortase A-associated)